MDRELARAGEPVTEDELATVPWQDVWSKIVDPILLQAQSRRDWDGMPHEARLLASLWTFHTVACRSGLPSFVIEEPPWLVQALPEAARFFGRDDVAELWEEATCGMDLPALSGAPHDDVQFTSQPALERLQHELVVGKHADLYPELIDWMRTRPELFASG
jgi:hypothetical protein